MDEARGKGRGLESVLRALATHGLLLESDAKLPSVAGFVVGAPVRGSWWGHPKGHDIFWTAEAIAAHPGVLQTKLVSGKVTYVHRRLWPPLVSVAAAREPWQFRGLSPLTIGLFERVSREGHVRTDDPSLRGKATAKTVAEAARELEKRLLVHGGEVHTATGAHAKRLEAWEVWARDVHFQDERLPPPAARGTLEAVVEALNTEFGGGGRLPWQDRRRAFASTP